MAKMVDSTVVIWMLELLLKVPWNYWGCIVFHVFHMEKKNKTLIIAGLLQNWLLLRRNFQTDAHAASNNYLKV